MPGKITFGSGDNALLSHWNFNEAGKPLLMTSAQRLAVQLNDNFTGITEHYFNFHGYRIV